MFLLVSVCGFCSLMFWCGRFLTTAPQESFSGLKPNTLKQLGQAVPTTSAKQVEPQKNTLMKTAEMQVKSITLTSCMSFCRILLSQQTEASLCLHWMTGEWMSCHSCLWNNNNNSTLFPALSVYFYVQHRCFIKLDFARIPDLWLILPFYHSFRIWDCLQREEGAAVKIRPVTTCTKTDTNLPCALNVAVSWPRRTQRKQRWKLSPPPDSS